MYTWKPITRTSLGGRNARSTLRSCACAEPAARSAPSARTSTSAYQAAHRAPRAERAIFFIANPIGVGQNHSVTTLTGTCALSAYARMAGLDAGVSRAVGRPRARAPTVSRFPETWEESCARTIDPAPLRARSVSPATLAG